MVNSSATNLNISNVNFNSSMLSFSGENLNFSNANFTASMLGISGSTLNFSGNTLINLSGAPFGANLNLNSNSGNYNFNSNASFIVLGSDLNFNTSSGSLNVSMAAGALLAVDSGKQINFNAPASVNVDGQFNGTLIGNTNFNVGNGANISALLSRIDGTVTVFSGAQNLNLQTTQGNLNVASIDVANSGGNPMTGTISALGGNLILADINVAGISGAAMGGDLTLSAGGTLVTSVISGNNVTMNAPTILLSGNLNAQNNLTLNAQMIGFNSGTASASSINLIAANDMSVSLSGTSNLIANSINFSIPSSASISFSGSGNLNLYSNGVALGSTSTPNINVLAGAQLAAFSNLALSAQNINIGTGSTISSNFLSVATANLTNNGAMISIGDVQVNGTANSLILAGSGTYAGNNVSFTGTNTLTVSTSSSIGISAANSANLVGHTIQLGANSSVNSSSTLNLSSTTLIVDVAGGNSATLSAGNSVNLSGNGLTLANTGSGIGTLILNTPIANLQAFTGSISLAANIQASNALNMQANGNIIQPGGSLITVPTLSMVSNSGSLGSAANQIDTASANISAFANGSAFVTNIGATTLRAAVQNGTFTNIGDLTIQTSTANNNLSISAMGNIQSIGPIVAGNNLTISTTGLNGNIVFGSNAAAAGAMTINASGTGSIINSFASILTAANITLQSTSGNVGSLANNVLTNSPLLTLRTDGNAYLNVLGDSTISATVANANIVASGTGNLTFSNTTATGSLSATSNGNINNSNALAVGNALNFQTSSGGNITIGGNISAGIVNFNSQTGSISTGLNKVINAAIASNFSTDSGDIGSQTIPLTINSANLTVNNSGGSVYIKDTASSASLNASSVRNAQIDFNGSLNISMLSASNNLQLSAKGAVQINGPVSAYLLNLTTTGTNAITINSNVSANTINLAVASGGIFQTSGIVSASSALVMQSTTGAMGTLANPINAASPNVLISGNSAAANAFVNDNQAASITVSNNSATFNISGNVTVNSVQSNGG